MNISLSKLPSALIEWVDTRLMPNVPSYMQFILGGSVPLLIAQQETLLKPLVPLGLVDEKAHTLNIDALEKFLDAGFTKANNHVVYWRGFIFTPEDGKALIEILNRSAKSYEQ